MPAADPYIPDAHAADGMLEAMGTTLDELFADIPPSCRPRRPLAIPPGMSECEARRTVDRLLSANRALPCFLGAGLAPHHVPAHVRHLVSRGELLTAYTSYQPEVSQGMLQALFEYQSMVAELTGLECVNASMYDWATALGEAALMCMRLTGRREVVASRAVAPWRLSVLRNYLSGPGGRVVEAPLLPDGRTDPEALKGLVGPDTACVYAEVPNLLGVLETEARSLAGTAHDAGARFVAGVDPWTLGVLEAPAAYGADVAVGEGLTLAGPPSFGGPGVGLFACRFDRRDVRQTPGRFVGMTADLDGRRGFTLTLQAREQAIRREAATSNICSNEALVAVAASITLASLGPQGLREVGEACMRNARYLERRLVAAGVEAPALAGPYFNELTVRVPDMAEAQRRALDAGVVAGLDLGAHLPELSGLMLVCATEVHSEGEMDRLASAIGGGGRR